MVCHRGVVADTHFRAGFDHVVERTRRVIVEVCGPDAITHDSRPAHMELCYASGYGYGDDDHDLQRQIRHEVLPGHGTLNVGAVDLVETEQDLETYCYDSTVLHRFTLAPTPSATILASVSGRASA